MPNDDALKNAGEDPVRVPGESSPEGILGPPRHGSLGVASGDKAEVPVAEASPDARTADLERQVLYLRAEIENVRKRTEKRCREALEFAAEPLLVDLLPVLDDLERAIEHARAPATLEVVRQGLEQIAGQFRDALVRYGVAPVAAEDETFDPSVHEAVRVVPGGEPGRVVEVHEGGYRFKGRLLRPARVSVGQPTAAPGFQQREAGRKEPTEPR